MKTFDTSAYDNEYDGFYHIIAVNEDLAAISWQFLEIPGPMETKTQTENIEHYDVDAKAATADDNVTSRCVHVNTNKRLRIRMLCSAAVHCWKQPQPLHGR